VSVLAGSRDTDGPHPVVVEMGQLVSQLLMVLGLPSTLVFNDVEVGGRHSASSYSLRDQVEVIAILPSDDSVDDCPTLGIVSIAFSRPEEESRVDSLRHNHEGESDGGLPGHSADSVLDVLQLDIIDMRNLPLGDSIPVDDNPFRQLSIGLPVEVETFDEVGSEVV